MLSFQNVEPAKAFLAARQLGTHDSLLQTAWAAIIEWKGLRPAPDCRGKGRSGMGSDTCVVFG